MAAEKRRSGDRKRAEAYAGNECGRMTYRDDVMIDERHRPAGIVVPAEVNRLVDVTINCALKIHRRLGPGLLESVYERCLVWELQASGLQAESQVAVDVVYKELRIPAGFRMDLQVEGADGGRLAVELKAVDSINPLHRAQLLTYLRILDLPLGMLINFNSALLMQGVERVINKRWSQQSPSTS